MRKKIVAGNWKMNKTFGEAEQLISDIAGALPDMDLKDKVVILCPPYVYLEMATDIAAESKFEVGSQNLNDHDSGAYTGEISAPMLQSLEVHYAVIGHSERRQHFLEDHEFLAGKVTNATLRNRICPIFCCGERLSERETGNHFAVVQKQLEDSLFHLEKEQFRQVVLAYEPVWAIGTGVNATPQQAQEMHRFIRDRIAEKYDTHTADDTPILYGGSCNSGNARELFGQPDVDGGLIGGSSLKAEEFLAIVSSF